MKPEISTDELYSFQFKAMNTNMEAGMWVEDHKNRYIQLEAMMKHWFQWVENKFSRFVSDSELSKINKNNGTLFLVSETMLEVLQLAIFFQEQTEGIYNPFILNALETAGYRNSFETIKTDKLHISSTIFSKSELQKIQLDFSMKSVQIPSNQRIDLGGIVKGWAVDRLAAWLQQKWKIKWGMLNAGGDIRVWGRKEENEIWEIGIPDPWVTQKQVGIISVHKGAAATSGIMGRQWKTNLGLKHHLIDPRTMLPSESNVVQCTVASEKAVDAEIIAKVICILGSEQGVAWLRRKYPHCQALFFTKKKEIHYFGDREQFTKQWSAITPDYFHQIN